jgi:2-oxoglutarate dehydrogenase E2 component (dihydrolipoamide succinyltransferase)
MSEHADILAPIEQEGTKSVVRAWLKKVGDAVKRDEPIVELETDKVAVEVAAPADGVLMAIALSEGDEAAPGAKLGVLKLLDRASSDAPSAGLKARGPSEAAASTRPSEGEHRLSPLVKRLIAEHTIPLDAIIGSGRDGRITHKDVAEYLNARAAMEKAVGGRDDVRFYVRSEKKEKHADAPTGREIRHDFMRKSIAEHMSRSVATAPHVTAVFEADFSAIAAHRAKHKDAYAKQGAALTYSAYIVRAAAEAMKVSPNVNARWHDDFLEVFEDVNIGMGVALGDKGLIVPVIRRAQTLSLLETAKQLTDLTERARKNQLKPADVQGGTFTISNHGVSGSLVATPIIINQPQSAILGVGKLEKRVVVREIDGVDAILVRPMAYVSLTIDHRVLDGHQTNGWLTRFVEIIETWPQENE